MPALQSLLSCARRILIGVLAAYVFTSLALGGCRAAETVFDLLAAGWGAGVFLWQLFGRHRFNRESLLGRRLRTIESFAGYLAILVVLAEITLRAASGTSPADHATLDAHRMVPGHDYGAGLRGNLLGYPGREFCREKSPGQFRIAALGNSFAVGPTVPFADNYLTLLETLLPRVELYNFGMSGAGLRDYVSILRTDVWDYHADLVLVSILISHDLTEALPRPRYLDPRQQALYLFLAGPGSEPHSPTPKPNRAFDRLTRPALTEEVFQEVRARRLDVFRAPPSPSMEKKWQRAWADIRALASGCRQHGVPIGLVLIPDECQTNPQALESALNVAALAPCELDLDLPQRRLRDFCKANEIACLDLRPAFTGVLDAHTPRDTHWSVKGNRVAADAIATWLRQEFLRER